MKNQYVTGGNIVELEFPYSEVCMHLRVAGRVMKVEVVPQMTGRCVAQLLNDDGSNYSFSILMSEAGFYRDDRGYYYYPPN